MDKEKILEMSRAENKNQDERERAAMARAGQAASAVGGIVCAVFLVFCAIFRRPGDTTALVAWTVYLSITGTSLLVKYRRLGKKHELVFGLIQLALALLFFVFYVMAQVK